MIKIYMAGPIGYVSTEDATGWRKEFNEYLNKIYDDMHQKWQDKEEKDKETGYPEYVCGVDPMRGKITGGLHSDVYTDAEIVDRDKLDIRNVDAVLAYLPDGVVGYGTPMEIMYAFEQKTTVYVICSPAVWEHPWIHTHAVRRFDDWKQAADYLFKEAQIWEE